MWLLAQIVFIGSFAYQIVYSPDTLGETQYPMDDNLGHRYIVLPTIESQIPLSWEHETLHACMHNHSHHYKTKEALKAHLENEMYSEEELVTTLTPCLIDTNKVDLRSLSHRKQK